MPPGHSVGEGRHINQIAIAAKGDLKVVVLGDSVAWSMGNQMPKLQGLAVDDVGRLGCGVLPPTLMAGNNPVSTDPSGNASTSGRRGRRPCATSPTCS